MHLTDPHQRLGADGSIVNQRLQRDDRFQLRRTTRDRWRSGGTRFDIARRLAVSAPRPRHDAGQLQSRVIGKTFDRVHQMPRARVLRLLPDPHRFLMRQHGEFTQQPQAGPRAAGERDRRMMPRALECRRGTAGTQVEAHPLDEIGESQPVGLEPRVSQFEQERRDRGAARLDARSVGVDPRRHILHETKPEWPEVLNSCRVLHRLVAPARQIGVEHRGE